MVSSVCRHRFHKIISPLQSLFAEVGMDILIMTTASVHCSFGVNAQIPENSRNYPSKSESSTVNFHPKGGFFKISFKPSSGSSVCYKGLVGRVYSLPEIGDVFPEEPLTPILDTIESPMHLKNLSSSKRPKYPLFIPFECVVITG